MGDSDSGPVYSECNEGISGLGNNCRDVIDMAESHITESWLNNQITDNMIDIPGFSLLRNDRPHKKGGGTCIYINHRLQFEECSPSLSLPEIEIQSITLLGNDNISQSFKPIIIVLIYRPPQGNHNRALDLIKQYISAIPDISQEKIGHLRRFKLGLFGHLRSRMEESL